MKFIDEAIITVHAGNGGDGCLSFRREKFIEYGGPNGGDGGDGGSVILEGNEGINTLIDFRYKRSFKANNGQPGQGKEMRGKSGVNLIVQVPLGTLIHDQDTDELITDITEHKQQFKIAQGGFHGLGNTRFKSSINRSPRKISKGTPGESYRLRMELKVLADVGLLGLPNAGKSTLVSVVSAARPKIADYPFTTIQPSIGLVRVDEARSFVMADIPGIIEGAAEGAGLGIRFLKHVARTRLLLHMIDIAPIGEGDPVEAARTIINEVEQYSPELAEKPRWLVLNKVDVLSEEECQEQTQRIIDELQWQGPCFNISALTKQGLDPLVYAVMEFLEGNEE